MADMGVRLVALADRDRALAMGRLATCTSPFV
jgi:hypothetical protein